VVRKDENAWWSLAPHDVSIILFIMQAEPVTVTAQGQAYLQKGVEDVVFAAAQFADGRMAHIHVSWFDPHKTRMITLVGADKMATFDDMDASEKLRIYDKGVNVRGRSVATTRRSASAPATFSFRRRRAASRCGSSACTSWTVSRRARPPAATAATACGWFASSMRPHGV